MAVGSRVANREGSATSSCLLLLPGGYKTKSLVLAVSITHELVPFGPQHVTFPA